MDNSIQINKYLRNEMNAVERAEFESRLNGDNELQQEFDIQQKIINATINAGLKIEFARGIRKRIMMKRAITYGLVIVASFFIISIIYFRDDIASSELKEKHLAEQKAESARPYINPPSPLINVPVSEYYFDAEKGETIYHPSGSVIHFPASSLVDEAGIPVKGKVKITYREFSDPIDFYLSGIPMDYDSAGRKYNFESSGMCEIKAFKDDKPVFVNKDAQPEINLSGTNNNKLHNLYILDTVNRRWNFIGKDVVTEIKDLAGGKQKSAITHSLEKSDIPVKPVKPAIAEDDKPAFSIEVEPGSFEELFVYNGLKFQVEDEKNYHPSDAQEHWDNAKLDHTSTEGVYVVTFTNSSRKVSYKVKPVLVGDDYESALKIFKEKSKEYDQALQKRLVRQKAQADSIKLINKKMAAQLKAEQEENIKINNRILARNKQMRERRQQLEKEIERQEKKIREQNEKNLKEFEREQAAAELQRLKEEQILMKRNQTKYTSDIQATSEVMRTFSINNFGIWNCDHPQYSNNELFVTATFTDNMNNIISLPGVSVVYKGLNGIMQFPTPKIRIIPGSENMIWGIKDLTFYYFSFNDFLDAKISRNTYKYTFRMRNSDRALSNYNEIREFLEKL